MKYSQKYNFAISKKNSLKNNQLIKFEMCKIGLLTQEHRISSFNYKHTLFLCNNFDLEIKHTYIENFYRPNGNFL